MFIKEKVEYHDKEYCGYVDIGINIKNNNKPTVRASFDIDNLKPFFTHPSTGKNIYIILDPCHILKLIRNCLAFKGILMDKDNNIINWLYFIKLVQLQEKEA
ncbi:hypothetical protein ACFW04_012119 [Cataglyphis niger]